MVTQGFISVLGMVCYPFLSIYIHTLYVPSLTLALSLAHFDLELCFIF